MPVSGNFTDITLGPDAGPEILKVNGETQGDVDHVEAILIAISRLADVPTLSGRRTPLTIPSVSVVLPAGQSQWTATLPQDQAPFQVGDELLLTGVMLEQGSSDRFSWQQVRTVQPDTAPATVR